MCRGGRGSRGLQPPAGTVAEAAAALRARPDCGLGLPQRGSLKGPRPLALRLGLGLGLRLPLRLLLQTAPSPGQSGRGQGAAYGPTFASCNLGSEN